MDEEREDNVAKITAKYDRTIRAVNTDPKTGEVTTRKETLRFTFGHIGSAIGGGVYITKGGNIPETIVIKIPKVGE